jgi:hypothetical protein
MSNETIFELIKYYDINEDVIRFSKNQYLDNGEGYYFTAYVEIEYDVVNHEIQEITIDGYTLEQLDKKIGEIDCPFLNKYDTCVDGYNEDESQESEDLLQQSPCEDCRYLEMIYGWIQSLWDGNI